MCKTHYTNRKYIFKNIFKEKCANLTEIGKKK